ncbi:MAG: hypothetical protein ACJ73S_27580 [Mycobacteriales bacterium]
MPAHATAPLPAVAGLPVLLALADRRIRRAALPAFPAGLPALPAVADRRTGCAALLSAAIAVATTRYLPAGLAALIPTRGR